MENENKEKIERVQTREAEETIDILHLLSVLWRKAWIIVLAGIILAGACFGYANFMIPETYSSSIMMYVNNETNIAGYTFSIGDLTAAQSLVNTYLVILRSRETLELVIDQAGSDLTYGQLAGMISASAVNNTEIFSITVTTTDPEESRRLAEAISEILPMRVETIIEHASMRLVSGAIANYSKVGPNVTRYTAMGLLAGILLAAAAIVVLDLLNDVIRDEEHVLQTYDIPILALIPDLMAESSEHGKYYGDYAYGKPKNRKG